MAATKGLGHLASSIRARLVPYIQRVKDAGKQLQQSAEGVVGSKTVSRAKKVGKAAIVGGSAALGYKAGKKVEKKHHETGLLRGPKKATG